MRDALATPDPIDEIDQRYVVCVRGSGSLMSIEHAAVRIVQKPWGVGDLQTLEQY